MKRLILVLVAVAAIACGGWYFWNVYQRSSQAPVSALLPANTIFLAHLPDFNKSREEWRHSDLCQIYREPAVQAFLRKPLDNVPRRSEAAQTLNDIAQLDPKNGFLALTSIDDNSPRLVAGFRFRGNPQQAEPIIGKWRAAFLEQNPGAQKQKIQYHRHEIEFIAATPLSLATVYDRPWFFAATDLGELKALLDRADHRATNPGETLESDQAYREAIAHRPSSYALFFYLQPKPFSERLAALRAAVQSSSAPSETTMLEKMRCAAGSIRFENGKIRDVFFMGMPKLEGDISLTRYALGLGTRETFLYLALLLNLGKQMEELNQLPALGNDKIFQSLAASGITAEDWKAALGLELNSLAEWPAGARWPSLLLTLPVKDMAKAARILEAVTQADANAGWTQTEKDGARYFSRQSSVGLVAINPTVALTERLVVVGFDPVSVEEAVKRSRSATSELLTSPTYSAAARLLPAPTNFFSYLDTALLYSRLDASLRPMLIMAASFLPAMATWVDPGKLPPPEVITRHLSPIVASQRYDRNGYVVESIGPITLDQSIFGLAILGGLGATLRQAAGLPGWATTPSSPSNAQPTASPSPTP